jgi:hypothetical protein
MTTRVHTRIAAIFVIAALGGVAAIASAGSAASKSSANPSSSTTPNGLYSSVVATTRGPLHVGDIVRHFIYVANSNRLTGYTGGSTRATLPNAFVVSTIDVTIFVDGVQDFASTETPPPNAEPRSWSGHWPSTVTCPAGSDPCNVVGNPAVVPGEKTAILYTGWAHGADEPDGTYIFRHTMHGTLNGTPVDLTADSQPIEMIR